MGKFFKRGIGLIGMICLLVAFAFLVHPVVETANSPQDQDNQVIKMLAATPSYALGTVGEMLWSATDQVIVDARPTFGAGATIDQRIETATGAHAKWHKARETNTETILLMGYNQNAFKRDAYNRVNTAIERPSMSVVLSNLPGQRNLPLKVC